VSRAPLLPILTGAALVLAALVAFELWDGVGDVDAARAAVATRPLHDGATPAGASGAPLQTQRLVAQILARPLFAPDRRPEKAPSAATDPDARPAPLPRLAGIVTIFETKLAIFQPTQGKPIVVGEGAEIDGHKVQSIGPEEIVLVGPEGTERLRPLPDPAAEHISRPVSGPAARNSPNQVRRP
jgi:hypothetical protein